jgi:hypothetical protein
MPEPPEDPLRLKRLLWVDLSPLPPDEFSRQTASRWIEAEQVQAAWRDGVEDARSEAGGR